MELDLAIAVGEETVVADAHESFGKHVQEEATNELLGLQSHGSLALLVSVVFPAEDDLFWMDGEEAMVGDGHPVGIAGQVFKNLLGTPERRFAIDHPVAGLQAPQIAIPAVSVGKMVKFPREAEPALPISFSQIVEKLLLEESGEDPHG